MPKSMLSVFLIMSLAACSSARSIAGSSEFEFASVAVLEGRVTSPSGVALAAVQPQMSLSPVLYAEGYVTELPPTDREGRFSGRVGRLAGAALAVGQVEVITGYLVVRAMPPAYAARVDGSYASDSVLVRIELTSPRSARKRTVVAVQLVVP